MCEIEMVSVEKMEDILHEEEMRNITKEVLKKTKRNREKRIAREVMLAGPTLYIDTLRKSKVPITQTDIKEAVNPTRSKILESIDWQEKLTGWHALGHMHGLYLRIGVYSFLFAVYMWL